LTSLIDYNQDMGTPNAVTHPQTVAISEFKARCLSLVEHVRRTGQPLIVTKHGRPIAEVIPASADRPRTGLLGSASDTGRILGDIVSPASAAGDWEVIGS